MGLTGSPPLHSPIFPCLFQAFEMTPRGHQPGAEKVPTLWEPGCRVALAPSLRGPWRSCRIRLGDRALQRKGWEAFWREGGLSALGLRTAEWKQTSKRQDTEAKNAAWVMCAQVEARGRTGEKRPAGLGSWVPQGPG